MAGNQVPNPTKWINENGSPTIEFFKFIVNLYNSGLGGGIAPDTIMSNLQSTASQAVGNTLSAILDDLLTNARGSIAVRGAAVWQGLAIGADGKALVSDGADLGYQLVDALAAIVTMDASGKITTASGDLTLDSATHLLKLGTASAAAAVPAAFSAARTLAIKDGSGTTYYIPLATATW